MNPITGKIVAKTPPFQLSNKNRDSVIYVWIMMAGGIKKFCENATTDNGLSTVCSINDIFLTIAASEVGDEVEFSYSISSSKKIELFYLKNLSKPFLY